MQNSYRTIIFDEALKENGLKRTKGRQEVFRILLLAGRPQSRKQICTKAKNINSSTVYRILDVLQRAGVVRIVPQGFKILYELGEIFVEHHHHAICEKCGDVQAISCRDLELVIEKIMATTNMEPSRHHIELYGICEKCRQE